MSEHPSKTGDEVKAAPDGYLCRYNSAMDVIPKQSAFARLIQRVSLREWRRSFGATP